VGGMLRVSLSLSLLLFLVLGIVATRASCILYLNHVLSPLANSLK
jgi:hypothetical protein